MSEPLEIDGSLGEGGGQVLRSSLTLSILCQRPFTIKNIRANRSKPGLKAQHLTAIQAATLISQADVTGDELHSTQLSFSPKKCVPGNYFFDVKTAGATSLVLQTIHLPLSFAGNSIIDIKGGTHVPFSPVFEFIQHSWAEAIKQIMPEIDLTINQAGFFPKGGGHFQSKITQCNAIDSIELIKRPAIKKITIDVVASKLPEHVSDREIEALKHYLKKNSIPGKIGSIVRNHNSMDSGNCLLIHCHFKNGWTVSFSEMGKRGRSSEVVAERLGQIFVEYWRSKAVVDEHLADQLLLPLSFAKSTSQYTVSKITQHLLTNAQVIQAFSNAKIEVDGAEGKCGLVKITP
ncbi:RNA 3'-terminal phosphate cyclase [Candidatus Uabimicrobium sp. HlEnr_7]|uniref:RNA 3'-terminal phosphate cyclase n=1 Tax=Candidatus Uabimicrobium helgolandensis TaxID=3095367 RepID=UPI003558281A